MAPIQLLARDSGERDRLVLHEVEGDEIFGVEHFERRVRTDGGRRLQRQRVEQRQPAVVEVEPVLGRRLDRGAAAIHLEPREIVIVLQRIDIDLGERLQLVVRQLAVAIGVEALDGEGGEGLVELPDVADRRHLAVGVEDDLLLRVDEDMRMRLCRGREERCESEDDQGSKHEHGSLRRASGGKGARQVRPDRVGGEGRPASAAGGPSQFLERRR